MDGEKGKFVFLFNHGEGSRSGVAEQLERPSVNAREIVTGETRKTAQKNSP
jgi:hypothetical protein